MKLTACVAAMLATGWLLTGFGCRTPVDDPMTRIGAPPPTEWSVSLAEHADKKVHWVAELGGPALEALVMEALLYNRDLAATAARVRQAWAQARLAGAQRRPALEGSFTGSRIKSVFANPFPEQAGMPELLETETTRYDLGAELSWEADLWGRLGDTTRAAEAGFAAAQSDFEGARQALAGEVARRWLEYVEATRQLALAIQTAENFQLQERILARRFDAGLTAALDLRLARTSARAAEAEIAGRRRQQDMLARALEVLLGRYPNRMLAAETEWPEIALPPDPGIPAEVVQRRPDLQAAEARYAAAVLDSGAARKLRYPRLTLSAGAGTASTRLGDLLNTDFGVWSLLGGLSAPLFTAGRISTQIDAAGAAEHLALEEFAAILLNAYREVETSLAAEGALAEIEARVTELANETARAGQRAWEEYERGLAEISTMLEAQRRAFESASQLITAQTERRLNRINLHLALGGGLAPSDTHAGRSPEADQP